MQRSRDRSRFGALSLLSQATAYLNGVAPYHYWDFINNRALFASADVGAVTSTPGWSYTRADAQSAYAETSAGVLVPFATGVLRRTDKGVLIEETRANLLTYSQDPSNAAWTKTASTTVSADTGAAPDGTTTADTITATATAGVGTNQAFTGTAAAYTVSIFAKAGTCTWLRIATNTGAVTNSSWFNLSSGTVGTVEAGHSASIVALADGWYRCIVTVTMTATTVTAFYRQASANGVTTGTSGQTITWWGAQAELGSFVSSYIPTTTASATRAADVLTVSSPGVSYPLSLFAEFERVVDTSGNESLIALHDGGVTTYAQLFVDSSDRGAGLVVNSGDQASLNVTGAIALAATTKAAFRVEANNFQMARGGTLATLDASGTAPLTPNLIAFGSLAGASFSFGYLRRAAIVNSAVNDAGLQAMTT